ncbi:MAG TPA: DNA-binding response regulator [Polyangia bacterium]
MARNPPRLLIVEDDEDLGQSISRIVRSWSTDISVVKTVAEALGELERGPDLIITDVRLPDGSGVKVAEAATRLDPMPAVVAISGQATPEEGFQLALAGVRAYIRKPIALEHLRNTIRTALAAAPELTPLAAIQVGHRPIQEVQIAIKKAMVAQALSLSNGNRTEAARMLQVSRQAIQQMIHTLDLK